MRTTLTCLTALALTLPWLLLGGPSNAGQQDYAEAGYTCMPTHDAQYYLKAEPLPSWWFDAENDDDDVLQNLIDDCLENGYARFDGDVGYWVDEPSYEECVEVAMSWRNDPAFSNECRAMGIEKHMQCLEEMADEDPDGPVFDHEEVCDLQAEACAIACMNGHPQSAC